MITRKTKLLSAAVVAAALIATVAVGRTVQTHTVAAGTHATHGSANSAAPGQIMPSRLHAIIACPLANESDCEKLEMLLPM
jgi:3-dehydroquinate dehydratase